MFDTERHYFIWGSSAVAVKLHMSLSIWTRGLFFCLFKWSLTRQDCFRPTVTPIKSLTRIKLRETTTDWQVFANTTVRFHLLQPCYIFHICQHVSVSHFWSRGIEFHRGEIFWRIFFFFFFHCFASPFFFSFPPHHNNVNLASLIKSNLVCQLLSRNLLFQSLAVVIHLNYSSEF